ncbi:MAG: RNA methyltransferase [Acholeplasmataceae bacterium]|nr:RNA methyltransferase [Acholeplasmataceae bacterium]
MITSRNNPKIKEYLKLKSKKYRDKTDLFLIYGDHLVEQALIKGTIVEILTTNQNSSGTYISQPLMKELSQGDVVYDIMAVCKKQALEKESDLVLIFDDIQNPDNAGALIRSAAAFGFIKIYFSLNSCDFYNEKLIRASQGSIFDVSHERCNLITKIKELKTNGYYIVGAHAHQKENKINDLKKIALVLGNEGAGISQEVIALCDALVKIPTKNVESLNVAVAGSILMYEWSK